MLMVMHIGWESGCKELFGHIEESVALVSSFGDGVDVGVVGFGGGLDLDHLLDAFVIGVSVPNDLPSDRLVVGISGIEVPDLHLPVGPGCHLLNI
jgi:hypothetical protein